MKGSKQQAAEQLRRRGCLRPLLRVRPIFLPLLPLRSAKWAAPTHGRFAHKAVRNGAQLVAEVKRAARAIDAVCRVCLRRRRRGKH